MNFSPLLRPAILRSFPSLCVYLIRLWVCDGVFTACPVVCRKCRASGYNTQRKTTTTANEKDTMFSLNMPEFVRRTISRQLPSRQPGIMAEKLRACLIREKYPGRDKRHHSNVMFARAHKLGPKAIYAAESLEHEIYISMGYQFQWAEIPDIWVAPPPFSSLAHKHKSRKADISPKAHSNTWRAFAHTRRTEKKSLQTHGRTAHGNLIMPSPQNCLERVNSKYPCGIFERIKSFVNLFEIFAISEWVRFRSFHSPTRLDARNSRRRCTSSLNFIVMILEIIAHCIFIFPIRNVILSGWPARLRLPRGKTTPRTARAIWSEKFARLKQVKQQDQTVIGDGSMLKFSTFASAPSILWCLAGVRCAVCVCGSKYTEPKTEIFFTWYGNWNGKICEPKPNHCQYGFSCQQLATSSLRAYKTFISRPPARNGIAVPVGWWDGSRNMFN